MNSNKSVEDVLCDALKHAAKLEERVEDLEDAMRRIVPNQDYDGHGMYHQCLIDKERRRAKLVDSIIEKTLGGLVWAVIVGMAMALWQSFLHIVRK